MTEINHVLNNEEYWLFLLINVFMEQNKKLLMKMRMKEIIASWLNIKKNILNKHWAFTYNYWYWIIIKIDATGNMDYMDNMDNMIMIMIMKIK